MFENQSYREILFCLKNKFKYHSDLLNCYDNLIYIYCNKYKELGISFKEYVQLDIVKKQLNKIILNLHLTLHLTQKILK